MKKRRDSETKMWKEPYPQQHSSIVMNSKVHHRSLGTRLRTMTPLELICLGTASVVILYFLWTSIWPMIFGYRPVRPVMKMGYLPQEKAEIDPCDCEQKLMKELMRGPLLPSDKRFIKMFKKHYLIAPSTEPYNLSDDTEGGPDDGLSDIVLELLNQKREGFFIESRVKLLDKETNKFESNTLHLEKDYGWEGVIFEPDEDAFKRLQSKNRKAWLIPGAISPNTYPSSVGFFPEADQLTQKEVEQIRSGRKKLSAMIVQGIPLATIVRVFKIDTIDYLSLAVGGRELEVLGTIPWEKVKIQVLTIEHARHQAIFDMVGNLLQQKSYIFISSVMEERYETSIYAHPSLFE